MGTKLKALPLLGILFNSQRGISKALISDGAPLFVALDRNMAEEILYNAIVRKGHCCPERHASRSSVLTHRHVMSFVVSSKTRLHEISLPEKIIMFFK